MKKIYFRTFTYLLFLCTICTNFLSAQETTNYLPHPQYPSLFKTIPLINNGSPEWVKLMYQASPNYYEVEAAYGLYYRTHTFEKNTHTQNYKYWTRRITGEEYLQPDGQIYMPTVAEITEKETFLTQKHQGYRERQLNEGNRLGNWTSIGPFETFAYDGATYQSRQVNVYTLTQSPSNVNVLYAGVEGGGLFKTIDKGLNWTVIAENLSLNGIGAIEVDPNNENIVYMAQGNRFYKTVDGGTTWSTLENISGLNITDISINPSNSNIVLTAGNKGLKRSSDGGTTWATIISDKCWDIELKTNDPNIVLVAKTNTTKNITEIWKSIDNGLTFLPKITGWFAPLGGIAPSTGGARIGVSDADANRVYVILIGQEDDALDGGVNDNNYIGIYRSDDAGETWSTPYDGDGNGSPDNEPGGPYSVGHKCFTSFHPTFNWGGHYNQGFYDLAIDVSDTDADKFLVGSLNLFKSENGGVTYVEWGGYACDGCGSGYRHPDIQEIEINGSDVWVATDGGLDYYDGNLDYQDSRTKGISGSAYWHLGQGWNDDVVTGGRYHNGNGAHYETYGTGKFIALGGGEAPTGYVNQGDNLKVYHSDIGAKQLPTTLTGGVIGITNYSMFPNQDYTVTRKSEIITDPRSWNTLYLGKDHKVWKSEDGGSSFTSIGTFGSDTDDYMLGIEIPRSNPDVIYAVQRISGGGKVWKTTNAGGSWTELTLPAATTAMYISISTDDENEIFLALDNGYSNTNKIFKSIDGGSSWSNISDPIFDGEWPKGIQVQDGTNGGVYVITTKKVYYKNNSIAWQLFSDGLPAKINYEGFLPFYRDAKVRLATENRGIWETPFYEQSAPIAQPMVSTSTAFCSRDVFQFEDYSIRRAGATWNWSFTPAPQWVSSTTVRNPQVIFGTVGAYSVSLTVTDVNGSDSKTVTDIITVSAECDPETVPGNAMSIQSGSSDYASIDALNLNTNTITFTAWIKRNGNQNSFAGVIFCRGGSTTAGLNFKSNNDLGYHWNGGHYNWNSNHVLPDGEWTHVALVIEPTKATIYMNGIAAVDNTSLSAEAFDASLIIGGEPNSNRKFKGLMDEVCIYNRALSADEIKDLMHLTKIPANDASLIHYYQFNRASGIATDRVGSLHATLNGGAARTTSTAPIGGGVSHRMTVNNSGIHSFTGTDLTLDFAAGTYPDGELVVSRIDVAPDMTPGGLPTPTDRYWVINNYGVNASFTPLASLKFEGLSGIITTHSGSEYKLHKRVSTASGNTWSNELDWADAATSTSLLFSTNNGISGFSQFAINKAAAVLPVELLNFSVHKGKENIAILQWSTAAEINSSHFEIERSADGRNFTFLTKIDSKGSPNQGATYVMEDKAPFKGITYYRLKQVDINGDIDYSPIRNITINALSNKIIIYPNPLSGSRMLTIQSIFNENLKIDMYDVTGKHVWTGHIQNGNDTIDLKDLPNGAYVYRVVSENYMQNGTVILE